MFMDELRCKVWEEIRQHDIRAFAKLLTPKLFANVAEDVGVRLGNSPLSLGSLVWLGIAAALQVTLDFGSVLTATLKVLEDQQNFSSTFLGKEKKNGKRRKVRGKRSKHDPRRNDPTVVSEEAFAKARRLMPMKFWISLIVWLGRDFEEQHAEQLRWNGFRLLAIDGTAINLRGWQKLKDFYGTANNGQTGKKKGRVTQARMVMLQFPMVRMPYRYQVSPLSVSEITLAEQMMTHLRNGDLLLMDRAFFSYGLFQQIHNQGAFFATRIKKNVRFHTIERLGKNDRLVRWTPKDSRGKWKKRGLPKSMELRVVNYQIKGFRPSAIVTNVTDPQAVAAEDWARLAEDCDQKGEFTPGVYHRRWEIETSFKELKVDQRMEKSLRSRTPQSLEYEIAGHVVLYMLTRWLIVQAAEKHDEDPLRLSFTSALRELNEMRQSLIAADPWWASRVLLPRLLDRVAEHKVPLRPGRHYPRPNDTKPKNKGRGQFQQPAKLKPSKQNKPRQRARKQTAKARVKG